MDFHIAVIGGDRRTACMIPRLKREGFHVRLYGTAEHVIPEEPGMRAGSLQQAVEGADIIAAGIPLLKGSEISADRSLPDLRLSSLQSSLRRGQKLFAGMIPDALADNCRERGIGCYDFMKNEPLAVFNAIATAEGAILEAMRHQDINLHGSKVLVLGYGRCGKVLAGKLRGLDADVTVCCRSRLDLAWAETGGLTVLPLEALAGQIHTFSFLFNTIPAMVLDSDTLGRLRKDALLLDIASAPGGVDPAAAQAAGVRLLRCPGLPGKYAARTSGERLAAYIIEAAGTSFPA